MPRKCQPLFLDKPSQNSVCIAGKYVNLSAIRRMQGIDLAYLSNIFAGKKRPSTSVYLKIASCMGMTIDELLEAIDTRVREMDAYATSLTSQYQERIAIEDKQDQNRIKRGKPLIPRLPGLRLDPKLPVK